MRGCIIQEGISGIYVQRLTISVLYQSTEAPLESRQEIEADINQTELSIINIRWIEDAHILSLLQQYSSTITL